MAETTPASIEHVLHYLRICFLGKYMESSWILDHVKFFFEILQQLYKTALLHKNLL